MKCKECQSDLLRIYTSRYKEGRECIYEPCGYDEDGELKKTVEYFQQEEGLFFCKKCKTFIGYFNGFAHEDTDEYDEIQEKISLDSTVHILSEELLKNSEKIDFSALKEACSVLKIDMSDVIKNLAFEIISKSRPYLISKEDKDDEIPF